MTKEFRLQFNIWQTLSREGQTNYENVRRFCGRSWYGPDDGNKMLEEFFILLSNEILGRAA